MKKQFLILLACCCMIISSCGGGGVSHNDIIGEWITDEPFPSEYVFDEDGTGSYMGEETKWEMHDDTIVIRVRTSLTIPVVAESITDTVIDGDSYTIMHVKEGRRKYQGYSGYAHYPSEELFHEYLEEGWLLSEDGVNWLETREGQKWLQSDEGKKWLDSAEGKEYQSYEFRPVLWIKVE